MVGCTAQLEVIQEMVEFKLEESYLLSYPSLERELS